ncbi:hypothetical protein [Yinghuangia seranimata]|uniref:hypothetical protein n=1 Tax=Yinghuangia seranimata TaxID=408067 RepID=UPI00248B1F5E|nr:hypothetical protein [Yinghuangia seranimata]MDI2132288.1 hypothetical protein [Yinghuangia seranimata]
MIARRTGIAPTVAAAAASVLLASGGLLASAFTAQAADADGPFDQTYSCSFADASQPGTQVPSTFTTRVVVNAPANAVAGVEFTVRVAVSSDLAVTARLQSPPAQVAVTQGLRIRMARQGAADKTADLQPPAAQTTPQADGQYAVADEFTAKVKLGDAGTYRIAPTTFSLFLSEPSGAGEFGRMQCSSDPGDHGATVVVAPKDAPTSASPSEQRTLQQDVQGGVKDAGTGTPTPTATDTATATTGSSGTSSASGGDLAHTGGGGPGLTAFAFFTASLLMAGLAVILALPHRRGRRAQT